MALPTTIPTDSPVIDPLGPFARWSASHWAAIAVTLIVAVALTLARRRFRDRPAARKLDLAFAAFAAVTWVATQILQATLDEFPATTALPLHVSDLTALAVPIALLWPGNRWARVIVYYWGLVLATPLAFLIPELRAGPARLGYWLFWLPHLVIVSAAAYDLFARDYRPTWSDYGRAATASVLYALLIAPFNAATAFSYGYLGAPRTGEPAALRLFGPWPWRVLAIVLTGLLAMALLTLPWVARTQMKRTRSRVRPGP